MRQQFNAESVTSFCLVITDAKYAYSQKKKKNQVDVLNNLPTDIHIYAQNKS